MEYRLGPRRYAATPREGAIPRLSEDLRESVVFIGWQKPGPVETAPIDPKGTGFLVGDHEGGHLYLVTARHVAEKVTPPFVIRINRRHGGVGLVHIERPEDIDWCFHDDETVDLAVAPINIPTGFEVTAHTLAGLVGDREVLKQIDAGDIAYVVGLFHLVHGTKRNLPIVHAGHIAMLPADEPIPVDGIQREAYLVQTNAISGCSGSPVFTIETRKLALQTETSRHTVLAYGHKSLLLGVWSASWKVKGSQIVAVKSDDDDKKGGKAPLGMGVVTPFEKLYELFQSKQLQAAAAKRKRRLQIERAATSDLAMTETDRPEPVADNPAHLGDFKKLVGAAARKKPQGE